MKHRIYANLIWKALYSKQNQLGRAVIKALDILDSLGARDMPVFGHITQRPQWELWIGFLYPEASDHLIEVSFVTSSWLSQYCLRPVLEGKLSTFLGSMKFFRLLASVCNFFTEIFDPRVLNRLRELRSAPKILTGNGRVVVCDGC